MRTFRKTMFMVVLATASASVPAISHAFKICDANGQNCFEFECLPAEKTTLGTLPEVDPVLRPLCSAPQRFTQGARSRQEALNRIADGCIKGGGVLKDKGSRVTCAQVAKPVARPAVKAKSNCEAMGQVWDGGKGEGGCTGPRTGSRK